MEHARDTDVMLGLSCPTCRAALSLLPGRRLFTFHCKAGHAFYLRQLFQASEQEVRRGLRALSDVWEDKHETLRRVARLAERDGRPELARVFEREAEKLEDYMRTLRNDHLNPGTSNRDSGSSRTG